MSACGIRAVLHESLHHEAAGCYHYRRGTAPRQGCIDCALFFRVPHEDKGEGRRRVPTYDTTKGGMPDTPGNRCTLNTCQVAAIRSVQCFRGQEEKDIHHPTTTILLTIGSKASWYDFLCRVPGGLRRDNIHGTHRPAQHRRTSHCPWAYMCRYAMLPRLRASRPVQHPTEGLFLGTVPPGSYMCR